jgi:signal transduction histidine kinase
LNKVANRFGKIGSRPELKPCVMNDVVEEVVNYYRRRLPFEGKGIQIVFRPAETPPIPLNDELFSWALENLVKNALQAVDAKAGRIEIETATDRDQRHVTVTLRDNGRGISAAAARKIFRPGFTTKKRGWGLGLTLVRRIVEEYHQGRVWLEHSRPGETVFKLQLPAVGTA